MDLVNYLEESYGYDEPIFTNDLTKELDINKNTLRQLLKRAVDQGKISRYDYKNGVYFIPNPNSFLKKKTLSFNKVISKEYLVKNGQRIGYITGLSFANQLNLTTQNAAKLEIVTRNETNIKRDVNYKIRQLTLRKPRVKEINDENYKVFQIFDLINDFEKVSVEPIETAIRKIKQYLSDINIDKEKINEYLKAYPQKTQIKVLENNIINEITSK